MKIEKLTENKIRILLKNEDIKDKNIDLHTIMTKAIESQGFFLEMLHQAEEQLGFYTDGCKLLIEAYSSPDNDFVFTITKYLEAEDTVTLPRKRVVPKRKRVNVSSKHFIFSFEDFEAFCSLCTFLNHSKISARGLANQISLHEYNSTYYLVINGLNNKNLCYKTLFSIFSEFGKFVDTSSSFENKLLEHGRITIKHNALYTGIKYFA